MRVFSCSGPLSIGTPGELLAYHRAYEQFGGGVSWSNLFAPTIDLCERGFRVSHALAFAIKKNADHILNDTQLRSVYYRSNSGEPSFCIQGDLCEAEQ